MKSATHRLYMNFERTAGAYQPYLSRLAVLLVTVCAIAGFLYGVFLLEAVGQAAARTSAERQIEDLSSQLSALEGQYLAATRELTPERAAMLGYVTPSDVSTVIVDGSAASLSFAGH